MGLSLPNTIPLDQRDHLHERPQARAWRKSVESILEWFCAKRSKSKTDWPELSSQVQVCWKWPRAGRLVHPPEAMAYCEMMMIILRLRLDKRQWIFPLARERPLAAGRPQSQLASHTSGFVPPPPPRPKVLSKQHTTLSHREPSQSNWNSSKAANRSPHLDSFRSRAMIYAWLSNGWFKALFSRLVHSISEIKLINFRQRHTTRLLSSSINRPVSVGHCFCWARRIFHLTGLMGKFEQKPLGNHKIIWWEWANWHEPVRATFRMVLCMVLQFLRQCNCATALAEK